MSFICGVCGKSAPVGTRCTLIPVEQREFNHPFRPGAHVRKLDDGKREYVSDHGGKGVQTVREVKACVKCAPSKKAKAGTSS